MQPMSPNQPDIEVRYRTIFILWIGIVMSVVMFLVLARFTPTEASGDLKMSLILNSLGVVPLGLSFLLKQRLLEQSVTKQQLDLVQTAYVLAFALSEVAALFGLMDHFLNGAHYYYLGFVLAGLGLLLHFPRMQHLLDATEKPF